MLKTLIRWAGLSCSALAIFSTTLGADPLLTNSNAFRIPFAVDGAGPTQMDSAVLYVGVDGGPLENIQTVSAATGGFQYTAPADGHYSFAVQLTDNAGNVVGGEGPLIPELDVVVDTVAPKLTLQLTETGPGNVNLAWSCNETGIAPGSLRLQYAEGADGRWQTIPISPTVSGNASLTVKAGTSLEVRGYVSDLAGNQGTGSAQTVLNQIQPVTSHPSVTTKPEQRMTIPQQTQAVGPSPFASGVSASTYDSPAPSYSGGSQNIGMNAAPMGGMGAALPAPDMSGQHASANNYPANNYPAGNYATNNYPSGSLNTGAAAGNSYGTPAPRMSAFGQVPQQNAFNQQQNTLPAFGQQSAGSNFAGYGDSSANTSQAQGPQIVSNQIFNIDYQVEDVGPSGVSAVELFVTENNGRDWFRYGNDVDLKPPFEVDTRGEGTFGFAVRARNGIGFSKPAPQPGEQPNIVVTVDKSAPVVELGRPQVSVANGGLIRLAWRVSEQNPATSPIRLEYATSNSGPWTPVFDWQADQGGYEMPIQSGMPPRLHFRLLARDLAGNVTASQTNQPVIIDQRRPTARLLRVQPVSGRRPMGF